MNKLGISLSAYGTRLQRAALALTGYCDPVSLPLWLESRYDLVTGEFLHKWRVFAVEKGGQESASPGEYRAHQKKLSEAVGQQVILVIEKVPAFARDRMVEMGVPFISPFAQAYIPELVIDLTEKYPQASTSNDIFTPTAQLALLYHLLQKPLEECSGKQMAERIGCSPNMAVKVRDQFEGANLGKPVRKGRTVHFSFTHQGKDLWEAALKHLRSPVQHSYYVEEIDLNFSRYRAGLSALSELTMIADDVCVTEAISDKVFNEAMENKQIIEVADRDMATLKLEKWLYDPGRLTDSSLVDPLSLWLSLRDSPDERIQGELESLMEDIQWR